MKSLRTAVVGLAVFGMVVLLSGLSIAQEAQATDQVSPELQAKREARLKLLKDSAAALAQSNPDLAEKLQKMLDGSQQSPETQKTM